MSILRSEAAQQEGQGLTAEPAFERVSLAMAKALVAREEALRRLRALGSEPRGLDGGMMEQVRQSRAAQQSRTAQQSRPSR